MRNRLHSLTVSGGLSLLALGISTALHAQELNTQDQSAKTLDAVLVTGTNIRGAIPAGNEVLIIEAQAIEASGKATVGDFLRDLPANFAGGVGMSDNIQGSDASVAGSNMTGGQGVNLRGLGALSTLVLVNGRRVAAAGQYGDFVDVSTIPSNAVDNIEILLDGASAVYGSDAVGGVVNIILKRSDEGARSTIRFGHGSEAGNNQLQVGQTWGTRWDDGGLIVGYEYNRQDAVAASDLGIYRSGSDFSDRGGVNWRRFGARAAAAANQFNTPTANGWGTPARRITDAGLVPVTDGIGNTHDAWAMVDLLPETERQSVFFGFEQEIGDFTSLSGDLRYSRRRGTYNQGYQALFGTLGPSNPHLLPGVANHYGVLIDDHPLGRDIGVDSFAANVGASFALGGSWRGEAELSYSREEQFRNSDVQRNANIYDYIPTPAGGMAQAPTSIQCSQGLTPNFSAAAQAYCASLGYTPFNPWTTGPVPAQVLSQLIGYENLDFTSWLAQASFKVDGDLFTLGGGTAKLAAGIDYRRESIGGELDFNWRSIADQHEVFGTTERDVGALFAEMALPLIGTSNASAFAKKLDVSLAARYERSQGLGDFSTFNPKVGVDFKPIDDLTLRGSWGTSFHAPPMRYAYNGVQPITGGNGAFMRADLYRAPCNTSLVPLNGVSNTAAGCTFTAIVVSGGAGPTLRPEEAETWTVGFDWQPGWAPGLKAAASYFNLKVDDRIVRIQAGQLGGILNQLFTTGTTPYINSLEVNPDPARVQALIDNDPRYLGQLGAGPVQSAADVAMIVNATQLNLASLRMDGVDFNLGYGFDTSYGGSLEFFSRGTWLNSYEIEAVPGAGYVDRLGKYSAADGSSPVKLRAMHGVNWLYGNLNAGLTMNYTDDYECVAGCFVPGARGMPVAATGPVKVGAWKTFDLHLGYNLSGIGGIFSDSRVSFTAVNLTNAAPPFLDSGTNAAVDTLPDPYDPANATALGRSLVLMFDMRW